MQIGTVAWESGVGFPPLLSPPPGLPTPIFLPSYLAGTCYPLIKPRMHNTFFCMILFHDPTRLEYGDTMDAS